MSNIWYNNLDMDIQVWQMALIKLQNEGFINGIIFLPPDVTSPSKIRALKLDGMLPTRLGVDYVEDKLSIERSATAKEKLTFLATKFGKFGWDVLQAIIIEILKSFM